VILTEDFGMSYTSAKFAPQLLTKEQKENHLHMANECPTCEKMMKHTSADMIKKPNSRLYNKNLLSCEKNTGKCATNSVL
jgi:hypothetical protein